MKVNRMRNKNKNRSQKRQQEMIEKRRLKMNKNHKKREEQIQQNIDSLTIYDLSEKLFKDVKHTSTLKDEVKYLSENENDGLTESEVLFLSDFEKKNEMKLHIHDTGHRVYVSDYGLIILTKSLQEVTNVNSKDWSELYEDMFNLDWMVTNVENRKCGWGNQILKLLTSLSDKHNVSIKLVSDSMTNTKFWNTSLDLLGKWKKYLGNSLDEVQLRKWYEKHGFILNPVNKSLIHYNSNKRLLKEYPKLYRQFTEWNSHNQLIYPSTTLRNEVRFKSILGYKGTYDFESTSSCYNNFITGSYDRKYVDNNFTYIT